MQSEIKRKKRKTNSQREIELQQKKVGLVIPAAPFRRVVNEITKSDNITESKDIRYQQVAISALQTAAESFLVEMFQDANSVAAYSGRETLHSRDITLAIMLNK
tara:strand:+ start:433 stop:744 length:312 start_codon:yes stop_codon:yes gene_type:complete